MGGEGVYLPGAPLDPPMSMTNSGIAPNHMSSGGLAKNSEPIPFEYSCQVTSGG